MENNATLNDYLVYCYLNNYRDIDFFLDILPHETMHMFGFKGGAYEGVTESFTREIAKKYNIRNVPIAHQEETIIMQKIERIIGRKDLAKASFVTELNKENHSFISNLLDEKLKDLEEMTEQDLGIYLKYISASDEFFYYVKSHTNEMQTEDDKEYRESLYQKIKKTRNDMNEMLDRYIEQNREKIYDLGEDFDLSDLEQEKRDNCYSDVLSIQKSEIEELSRILDEIEKNSIKSETKSTSIIQKLVEETIEEQYEVLTIDEVESVEKREMEKQREELTNEKDID